MSTPVSPEQQTPMLAEPRSAITSAERLLVVRLSAMGDIIHAMPAIAALRRAKPDLEIGWLVEERWAELLCARDAERFSPRSERKPLVDCVHVARFYPLAQGAVLRGDVARDASRAAAKCGRGNTRSRSTSRVRYARRWQRVSAAPRCASGRRSRASRRRECYTPTPSTCGGSHVIEHALSLASRIAGQPLEYVQPPFPVDPVNEGWADHQSEMLGGKPMAILNPGAGWGAKCWPAESYGAVARALAERGMAVLINHGPGEEALAEAVRNSSGGVAVPLKCSVGELIALTRRARLFVGGDTGPMQLAAALRVPVVALFGPTRPERNGPFGTPNVVLRSPDSVNNTTHTDRRDEGLASIEPQAVIQAAERLLGEQHG